MAAHLTILLLLLSLCVRFAFAASALHAFPRHSQMRQLFYKSPFQQVNYQPSRRPSTTSLIVPKQTLGNVARFLPILPFSLVEIVLQWLFMPSSFRSWASNPIALNIGIIVMTAAIAYVIGGAVSANNRFTQHNDMRREELTKLPMGLQRFLQIDNDLTFNTEATACLQKFVCHGATKTNPFNIVRIVTDVISNERVAYFLGRTDFQVAANIGKMGGNCDFHFRCPTSKSEQHQQPTWDSHYNIKHMDT